ncbi:toll/interleukin-1 receptor domain-containing protein [Bacillus thuringiensis]|uniref:toll/interleukin-1 receptor domain-containing protein n=1 Tax=Bacillus thuringiensis TaxID=1428 RepID=UPI0020D288E2|nr:toll/interleukin-1 receptor domain-containing protein [Bacillus thuringiensis]
MLDVTKIQSIIEKLEIEKYNIHNSLLSVLRIARERLDIMEVLFLEYNIRILSKDNTKVIYDKVKKLSEKKEMPINEYNEMVGKVHLHYIDVRTCDPFDTLKGKVLKDQILQYPVIELISDLERNERLLASNVIPSGLNPQDLYFANLEKQKFDVIHTHQISVLTNVLNKIKAFMLNYLMDLEEILNNTEGNKQMSTQQTLSTDNKIEKIFISHASRDKEYVKELVKLLNSIGVPTSSNSIFCSSLSGYDIPHGEDIYDYLKNELNNNKTMVLFVLSDNYYQSAPCLNEMGAAWITSKKCSSVLMPNFDFNKIEGAIDPTQISFKMNDSNGLDKFRDYIIDSLELKDPGYRTWQSNRDDYLTTLEKLLDKETSNLNITIELERVRKQNTNLKLDLRFINVTEKDIEFQCIDIALVDALGEKLQISIEDDVIEKILLRCKENKIIEMIVPYDTSAAYQLRQNVTKDAVIDFRIV